MSKHQIAMNLWFIFCALTLLGVAAAPGDGDSSTRDANNEVPEEVTCEKKNTYPNAVCHSTTCTDAIKNHISKEFHAAFKYLYMGALFGQYIVERPGMANFFLASASEERSHAIQMMDYLNMRGLKYNRAYQFTNDKLWKVGQNQITLGELKKLSIKDALKEAVDMEIDVTKKILEVIKHCEGDYHAADVFTNPILEEQYTGMRKLQGAIKTMDDLLGITDPGLDGIAFAEYIFDQKMLNGELM